MAYENDHYRGLKKALGNYQMALQWADQARALRSMKRADDIDIAGKPRFDDGAITVRLKQSMKDEVLEAAAEKCERIAKALLEHPPEPFDIGKACHE